MSEDNRRDEFQKRMHGIVGSEEEYKNILTWAGKNLSLDEQHTLVVAIQMHQDFSEMAIEEVCAKYAESKIKAMGEE